MFYGSQHQHTFLDSEQFLSTILTHDKTWQTTSLFLKRFTMGWRVKFCPKPKRVRSRTRAHVSYLSLSVSHAQPHRRPKLKHKQKRTRTNWPLASILFLYASVASVSCVCSRLLCARFLASLLFIEAIAASPPAPVLFRVSVGNAKMIVLL